MKRIGLISDTHGFLDEKVFRYFENCDEIWHAGDIGSLEVAEKLEAFKPFRAVYGNIDDREIQAKYPEHQLLETEGLKSLLIHIAATPPKYNKKVLSLIKTYQPHLLICGHSHILRVVSDKENNNLLYINPGAAGNHGFHKIKTLIRFEIDNGKPINMQAIEIGKRGM